MPQVQALPYFGLNWAVSSFDRTHNLQIRGLWELPIGKGKAWLREGGFVSRLAGGWHVNTLLSLMSGLPFSITSDDSSLDLPGSTQRADQIVASISKPQGTGPGQSWFDPLAFREVTDPRFGNSGFNSLRGPHLYNLDFGLFRDFAITDRMRTQSRVE